MGAPAPRLRNLASNCESAFVRRMACTTSGSAVPHTIHPCIQYSSPNIEDAIKKKATSEKFLAKLIGQFKVLHGILFTDRQTDTRHTTNLIHVKSNVRTLAQSEDSRERECLKTTTHRIYGKLTNRRAPIRRIFSATFAEV